MAHRRPLLTSLCTFCRTAMTQQQVQRRPARIESPSPSPLPSQHQRMKLAAVLRRWQRAALCQPSAAAVARATSQAPEELALGALHQLVLPTVKLRLVIIITEALQTLDRRPGRLPSECIRWC